jgi:hypothetical protein
MESRTFSVTYEIEGTRFTTDFLVSGNLKEADLSMSAMSHIQKEHPNIKSWEISIISIS